MKFKVGDKIIGNAQASDRYERTGTGWTGEVVAIAPIFIQEIFNWDIEVDNFKGDNLYVNSEFFDLVEGVK